MAQHRRVRSRTTPQPDLPQRRTTRTTRSQSRDIDQLPSQTVSKATKRGVRDKSADSTTSAGSINTSDTREFRRIGKRSKKFSVVYVILAIDRC